MHDYAKRLRAAGWKTNGAGRWYHRQRPSGYTLQGRIVDWGYTIKDAVVRSGIRQRRG